MTALRKVLVVDDDPVVGASFNRVLSGKGYIVVAAENGADALAKLKDEKFDAVFTDLRMPGMDGLQVAENIKATQPWIPVVLVTGYGSAANEARARAAGVVDFLRKPLSPDMIEDSAANAVRTVTTPMAPVIAPIAVEAAAPSEAQPEAQPAKRSQLKNIALFLSAPFVGLVYAVLLPFVGLGMLLWFAGQALWKQPKAREALRAGKVALQLAVAPFVGLAYLIVLPFAALGMLAWMATKAAFGRAPAE
ncbi:MAG: response regulator receiver domain protein [Ramlibacter sp.]|jgi:CheY-like chemotaxis protein|nr:response regulator receiver domain protein [Ramlibacter sp.]